MGEPIELPAEPGPERLLVPALAHLPGHLVWRSHARVTLALADVLPPGVDIHAYAALLALSGGVTRSQQALSATIAVSGTTMVRVAAELAAQGLVQRVRNPADRRSYALTRTAEGAAAARRWRRHAEDLEDAVTACFTAQDREDLRTLLLAVCESDLAPDTPEPLRESIAFLITRVHFRLHRDFLAALGPLGIEPRHFGVLTALRSTGPVPQSELARMLGVSGASVVQMIDDLERRGLVERRRPHHDRRTQELHLLPGAAAVLEQATVRAAGILDQRWAALERARTEQLVELLRRFVTAP